MNDTATFDGWKDGFGAHGPDTDTWPVTPAVTPPVTPADTPADTWPATPAVTPGDEEAADTPLSIGDWEPVPGEPPAAPRRDLWTLLASLTRGSPLLLAGSLADELASPHPDTWTRHRQHVASHPRRPAGPAAGAGFTVAHLGVTGTTKLLGIAMTHSGDALSWAGKRVNRAGDSFLASVILWVIVIIVAAITGLILVQAASYLP